MLTCMSSSLRQMCGGISHLLLAEKCVGPLTSQCQTLVFAGFDLAPSSDELERYTCNGRKNRLGSKSCKLFKIYIYIFNNLQDFDLSLFSDRCAYNVRVRLKKVLIPTQQRLRSDIEKLRDPCTFQPTIGGGKFAPLIGLREEDMHVSTMITTYNTAVTDAAREIFGKERRWKSRGSPERCS